MSFLNALLDVGFDYGATGGPDAFGTSLEVVAGAVYANQKRQYSLGEWELGNRDVSKAVLAQRLNHWHAVRGQAYAFPYKDWNDYKALQQELALDGSSTAQLIKTYGGYGNDYIANIYLPVPSTVVLEIQEGGVGDWIELELDVDYALDDETGIVTFAGSPGPAEPDKVRWTGEFHKRGRYGVDRFRAQFVAFEQRGNEDQRFYALGALTVREERPPPP